MPAPLEMEKISWPEFEKNLQKTRTAIVPFGPIEEHGPHLSLGVDYIRPREIALRVARLIPVFVYPVLPVGIVNTTRAFPGTVTVSQKTLRNLVFDIAGSLMRHGIRHIIFLSGHSGSKQNPFMTAVVRDFTRKNKKIRCLYLRVSELNEEAACQIVEKKNCGHACEQETSEMLYLMPEIVAINRASFEFPDKKSFRHDLENVRKYWRTGIDGDARLATRTKGKRLVDGQVRFLRQIIAGLDKFI